MKTFKPGEWCFPKRSGFIFVCCDCGLKHKMVFRLTGKIKKRIRFKAYRVK